MISLVSLRSHETKTITFTLNMMCTARLETDIVVTCEERGYFTIPMLAESSPSCHLSIGDIKIGKMIGKGAYDFYLIHFLAIH